MDKSVFQSYEDEYPEFFLLEKTRLHLALGPNFAIEHVGSTAVPGLGGKGILDVVIGCPSPDLKAWVSVMEQAGYEYQKDADRPEQILFRRDSRDSTGTRKIHVYLTPNKGKDWRLLIAFRDYLIDNPDSADEYEALKKDAAKKEDKDGELYMKLKEKFIQEKTDKAL